MKNRKRKKRVKINYTRIFVTVIVILLITFVGVSLKNVISLHIEQNNLKVINSQLKKDKESLKEELQNVNDYGYIEEQARIQLRLIKPGEILYILDGDDGKNSDNKKTDKANDSTEDGNEN